MRTAQSSAPLCFCQHTATHCTADDQPSTRHHWLHSLERNVWAAFAGDLCSRSVTDPRLLIFSSTTTRLQLGMAGLHFPETSCRAPPLVSQPCECCSLILCCVAERASGQGWEGFCSGIADLNKHARGGEELDDASGVGLPLCLTVCHAALPVPLCSLPLRLHGVAVGTQYSSDAAREVQNLCAHMSRTVTLPNHTIVQSLPCTLNFMCVSRKLLTIDNH